MTNDKISPNILKIETKVKESAAAHFFSHGKINTFEKKNWFEKNQYQILYIHNYWDKMMSAWNISLCHPNVKEILNDPIYFIISLLHKGSIRKYVYYGIRSWAFCVKTKLSNEVNVYMR